MHVVCGFFIYLFFSVFSVVYVASLSMRTKVEAVPRPHGEPMLEDDVFVSVVAGRGFANPL